MDLSYASIPNANQELVILYRSPFMRHFVEDPTDPCNEIDSETFGQLFGNNFLTYEDQVYPVEEGCHEEIIGSKYDPDILNEDVLETSQGEVPTCVPLEDHHVTDSIHKIWLP